MSTDSVTVPELVPEPGNNSSQDSEFETVQFKSDPPVLEICSVCGGGLPLSTIDVKKKSFGLTLITGGGGATVSSTKRYCGLFAASGATTAIVSMYVPWVSPKLLIDTLIVSGVVPRDGLFSIHEASSTSEKSIGSASELTINVWGGGLAPPSTDEKKSVSSDRTRFEGTT
jgi:hypothetical protein